MQDADSPLPSSAQRPRAMWNVISVALPLLVLVVGLLSIAGMRFGTGDYGGRLGSAVLLILGMGAGCALGFIAAVIALIRGERWTGLTWVGLVGNGVTVIPIASLLLG